MVSLDIRNCTGSAAAGRQRNNIFWHITTAIVLESKPETEGEKEREREKCNTSSCKFCGFSSPCS